MADGFPASSRRLQATIEQANAWNHLKEWRKAADLLQQNNGVFQAIARTNAANEWVLRGQLLLGEALLGQKDYAAAEAALGPMTRLQLPAALDWERQCLACRILRDRGLPEAALEGSTNLLALSVKTDQRLLQARSAAFQADLFEQLGQSTNAIAAYEKNLTNGFPAEFQRDALLKITRLLLAQHPPRIGEAAQRLGKFLDQYPETGAADQALLTLGELRLREYQACLATNAIALNATNAAPGTNALDQAQTAFQQLADRFPHSPLVGKALLGVGWCYWYRPEDRIAESQAAFQSAAQRLQPSLEQAIAWFKLADTQFRQTNYAAALANYSNVLAQCAALPEVRTNLCEPALYQTVRAALAAGKLEVATNALAQLIATYPRGFHTDEAALLIGQEVRGRNPTVAREILSEFARRVPDSPLMPQVQLAVGSTYEQQEQWDKAIAHYDAWLATRTNSPAPLAEYFRAQACFQAGRLTNAFNGFTNFLARFPTNQYAPLAQWWVADYFFRQGGPGLVEAEKNYQAIYQNTNFQAIYQNTNLPLRDLSYRAMLMAGRAAVARQSWEDARDYFIKLANDTNCPPHLRAQAFFAYGDYWMSRDSTNKMADYQQAINAYDQSCKVNPSGEQAAAAWGAKANCSLQWALGSQQYDLLTNAVAAFQQVLAATNANVTARSIAKVGLGVTLEKQAQQKAGDEQAELLDQALTNYLAVFDGKILREGEKRDLFWTKEASLKAAHLAESLQQWDQAIGVYERLQEWIPALAARFQKNIDRCKELQREKN